MRFNKTKSFWFLTNWRDYAAFFFHTIFVCWFRLECASTWIPGLSSSWPSISCCNRIHSQLHSRAFPSLPGRSPAGMPSFRVCHSTHVSVGWTFWYPAWLLSLSLPWLFLAHCTVIGVCYSHSKVKFVLTLDSLHCQPFVKTPVSSGSLTFWRGLFNRSVCFLTKNNSLS